MFPNNKTKDESVDFPDRTHVSLVSMCPRQRGRRKKIYRRAVFHPLFLLIYPLNASLCLPADPTDTGASDNVLYSAVSTHVREGNDLKMKIF